MATTTTPAPIPGGYAIQPRCLFDSEIWQTKPPWQRALWSYLWGNANHEDRGSIKRGQILVTMPDLVKMLSFRKGYAKKGVKKSQVSRALDWMRRSTKSVRRCDEVPMITTVKTTIGIVVTICNYDFYQNPKNYESHNEKSTKATRKPQSADTINKNGKNGKNDKKEYIHEIVCYLNDKAGTSFLKTMATTHSLITARLNEGRTVADIKKVIDLKCSKWLKNEKMNKYLRPETLFNATKFDNYINELPKKRQLKDTMSCQ